MCQNIEKMEQTRLLYIKIKYVFITNVGMCSHNLESVMFSEVLKILFCSGLPLQFQPLNQGIGKSKDLFCQGFRKTD